MAGLGSGVVGLLSGVAGLGSGYMEQLQRNAQNAAKQRALDLEAQKQKAGLMQEGLSEDDKGNLSVNPDYLAQDPNNPGQKLNYPSSAAYYKAQGSGFAEHMVEPFALGFEGFQKGQLVPSSALPILQQQKQLKMVDQLMGGGVSSVSAPDSPSGENQGQGPTISALMNGMSGSGGQSSSPAAPSVQGSSKYPLTDMVAKNPRIMTAIAANPILNKQFEVEKQGQQLDMENERIANQKQNEVRQGDQFQQGQKAEAGRHNDELRQNALNSAQTRHEQEIRPMEQSLRAAQSLKSLVTSGNPVTPAEIDPLLGTIKGERASPRAAAMMSGAGTFGNEASLWFNGRVLGNPPTDDVKTQYSNIADQATNDITKAMSDKRSDIIRELTAKNKTLGLGLSPADIEAAVPDIAARLNVEDRMSAQDIGKLNQAIRSAKPGTIPDSVLAAMKQIRDNPKDPKAVAGMKKLRELKYIK